MNIFKQIFAFVLTVSAALTCTSVKAEEGMWLPGTLTQTRYDQMREAGLSLTPEEIYAVGTSSLKDAVVMFGGGTAVVVSSQGLLLTNYHCGYPQIQAHSTVKNDYLTNGFWANSLEEELPNPGFSVSVLASMEDITSSIMQNITPTMTEQQRGDSIKQAIARIQKARTPEGSYRADVRPLYAGNQYYLYVYEVFSDVRLVGAPPSAIGKFGGDEDNWTWPRHTGDFSVFRIYVGKDNKPAPYSPDNVPYQPKKYAPVSVASIRKGDFTMVYGFPGTTDEFVSSYKLDYLIGRNYPARVELRTQRLRIMDSYMRNDPSVRIQYASKYAGVSNAWKKWQGVIRGIKRADGISQKRTYEVYFTKRIQSDAQQTKDYGNLLDNIRKNIEASATLDMVTTYYNEAAMSVELLKLAGIFKATCPTGVSGKDLKPEEAARFFASAGSFYKDYSASIDRETFTAMMKAYQNNIPAEYQPTEMTEQLKKHKGLFDKWADEVYEKSVFRSFESIEAVLSKSVKKAAKTIAEDPVMLLYESITEMIAAKVTEPHRRLTQQYDSLARTYTAARLQIDAGKIFYPDGNRTLRIAFGRVEGYSPADAVEYLPFTSLEGIMEKDNPNVYEFRVPQALKTVYENKDFGRYADGNTVRVCFTASNHTTSGNSGSPVFNGKGELLGLNFDRNWEGTMNDFVYDPDQCRNITVDSRYMLFVIDKVYGIKRLVDEMTVVK